MYVSFSVKPTVVSVDNVQNSCTSMKDWRDTFVKDSRKGLNSKMVNILLIVIVCKCWYPFFFFLTFKLSNYVKEKQQCMSFLFRRFLKVQE